MNRKLLSLAVASTKRANTEATATVSAVQFQNNITQIRVKLGRSTVPLDGLLGYPTLRLLVQTGDSEVAMNEVSQELQRGTLDPAIKWVKEKNATQKVILAHRKNLI